VGGVPRRHFEGLSTAAGNPSSVDRFPRSAAVKGLLERATASAAKKHEDDGTPPLKPIKPEKQ
jgi:hypothetical protein